MIELKISGSKEEIKQFEAMLDKQPFKLLTVKGPYPNLVPEGSKFDYTATATIVLLEKKAAV